jgi:predicted TIM-barrel fold metal-dependent hydrolase
MRPFVFSCDAHIVEPNDLFTTQMSAPQWAPNAIVENGMRHMRLGENLLFKVPVGFHSHKVGDSDDTDIRRLGQRDLVKRLADMQRDGVDAEIAFPSLGLLINRITDRAAALEAARIYNDWLWDYLDGLRSKLVPAAAIPLISLEDGIGELNRVIAKGYKTVMMPLINFGTVPTYNDAAWDKFFGICAAAGIPLSFHTGVGNVNLRPLKGAGGALFNYTRQMNDAVDVIAALVGGGVLDRNPDAHILFAEHGAGWLLGLAERMDEVYDGHAPSIQPKLSRKPSEIVRDQVHCAFQNDIGCLLTVPGLSADNFLFSTDYPHSEGTFPFSQNYVHQVEAMTDLTRDEQEAVLGLNAARLFNITPQQVYQETELYLAAHAA